MKFGINDVMEQAKKVQEQMQKMQEEIANVEVSGESGAGMVKITMTGRHDVKGVEIDSSLLTEDKAILEDLIAAAVNDAVRKVESVNQEKASTMTGGMPFDFKMPF